LGFLFGIIFLKGLKIKKVAIFFLHVIFGYKKTAPPPLVNFSKIYKPPGEELEPTVVNLDGRFKVGVCRQGIWM